MSDRAIAISWALVALCMLLAAAIGALAGHFQPTDTWAEPPATTAPPVLTEEGTPCSCEMDFEDAATRGKGPWQSR